MSADVQSTRQDFYVYALFRESGVPFYVGKGMGRRWHHHARDARAGMRGRRFNIIRDMLARGVEMPMVKIHEGLTETVALQHEVALIAAIGRHPHGPLTNLTYGGDGVAGTIQTPEHIAKRAEANRGRKLSPEHIAKMSAANRGKKASAETRAKMSAVRRGRKQSPEQIAKSVQTRSGKKRSLKARQNMSVARRGSEAAMKHIAKLSAANRGKKMRPETRARMSAAKVGRKQSPEHVARRVAAHIGAKRSPETCARISEALRAGYERRRAK